METIRTIIKEIVVIVILAGFLEMLLPENGLRKFVKVFMGLFIIITLLVPVASFIAPDKTGAIQAWQLQEEGTAVISSVFTQGEALRADLEKVTLEECAGRLARQIEATVGLVPEIKQVQAKVRLKPGKAGATWNLIEGVWLRAELISLKDLSSEAVPQKASSDPAFDLETSSAEAIPGRNPGVEPVEPVKIKGPSPVNNAPASAPKGGAAREKETKRAHNTKEIEERLKDTVANFYGVSREAIQVELIEAE